MFVYPFCFPHSACFNPRTHTGAATCIYCMLRQPFVSIHAPTRGATFLVVPCIVIMLVSIHAPTQGATCVEGHLQRLQPVSIHAPTQGATSSRRPKSRHRGVQSTRPHRVRQSTHPKIGRDDQVSIHAPTQGATQQQERQYYPK